VAKLNVYMTQDIAGNKVAIGTQGLATILEEAKDEIIFASAGHRSLTQLVTLAIDYDEMIARDVEEMAAAGIVEGEFEIVEAEDVTEEEADDGTVTD
jgi:hypothetical protein